MSPTIESAVTVSPQLIVLVAAGVVLLAAGAAGTLVRLHTALVTGLVDLVVGVAKVLLILIVLLVLYLVAEDRDAGTPAPSEVSVRS